MFLHGGCIPSSPAAEQGPYYYKEVEKLLQPVLKISLFQSESSFLNSKQKVAGYSTFFQPVYCDNVYYKTHDIFRRTATKTRRKSNQN